MCLENLCHLDGNEYDDTEWSVRRSELNLHCIQMHPCSTFIDEDGSSLGWELSRGENQIHWNIPPINVAMFFRPQ